MLCARRTDKKAVSYLCSIGSAKLVLCECVASAWQKGVCTCPTADEAARLKVCLVHAYRAHLYAHLLAAASLNKVAASRIRLSG